MEPTTGIEPVTHGLRYRCSTAELRRLFSRLFYTFQKTLEQTFWLIFAIVLLLSSKDIPPHSSRRIALLECDLMERDTAFVWSYSNVLTRKRYDMLIDRFGSLEEAVTHIDLPLLRMLGCREQSAMGALNRLDTFDPAAYAAALDKHSIIMITWEDSAYPAVLREIADPPVFLYYKGSLDILNSPCIACVGTRDMTPYGKRVTEYFVPSFVQSGLVTVSGLALGIDAEVAEESLRTGGKTVAVLGHGLGKIYPSAHTKLAKRIVDEGGLLLSEFPLDLPPDTYTFPARNRIIAGLTLGTVVLEAGSKSGALITADLALEYGREVFAVPGQIFDPHVEGCHQLIAAGAHLAVAPEDILREIGIVVPTEGPVAPPSSDDPDEQRLIDALTTMPQSVSDLIEKAALDAAVINAQLTMLELQGYAKNTGGGMWVCTSIGKRNAGG